MREAGIPLKGYGIRLDSGDLAYLSKKAKAMLDAAGFTDAIISASNDLDEYLIDSLKIQGAAINSWGVGTNLITSKDCPSFGGVYKLAAILDRETGKFIPKIKLSENTEKVTNPGNKTIYRIYDRANHKIIADLICLADEVYDENKSLLLFDPIETWKKTHLSPGSYEMRELLVPVFKDGVCVYQSPKVMEIRDYCRRELDTLWDESRRLINPHEVHVDLSNELWHMKNQLLDSISLITGSSLNNTDEKRSDGKIPARAFSMTQLKTPSKTSITMFRKEFTSKNLCFTLYSLISRLYPAQDLTGLAWVPLKMLLQAAIGNPGLLFAASRQRSVSLALFVPVVVGRLHVVIVL